MDMEKVVRNQELEIQTRSWTQDRRWMDAKRRDVDTGHEDYCKPNPFPGTIE